MKSLGRCESENSSKTGKLQPLKLILSKNCCVLCICDPPPRVTNPSAPLPLLIPLPFRLHIPTPPRVLVQEFLVLGVSVLLSDVDILTLQVGEGMRREGEGKKKDSREDRGAGWGSRGEKMANARSTPRGTAEGRAGMVRGKCELGRARGRDRRRGVGAQGGKVGGQADAMAAQVAALQAETHQMNYYARGVTLTLALSHPA